METTPKPPILKKELPLDSDARLFELVERFEACELPINNWTHRAHLAVGLVYLSRLSFDEATIKIRQRINDYNRAMGNPQGYNETVTILFLRKIKSVASDKTRPKTLHELLVTLEDVCSVAWIYRYYSKQLVWSDEAKKVWQEPDLRALDF